jgi:hypothetical protein
MKSKIDLADLGVPINKEVGELLVQRERQGKRRVHLTRKGERWAAEQKLRRLSHRHELLKRAAQERGER